MATKKDAHQKSEHIKQLKQSTETYTKHRIECWVCNEVATDRDVTEATFARELYAEGWRWFASDFYQTVGPACPECAKKTDKDFKDEEKRWS